MICNDASFAGGPMGEEFYGVAKLVHNRQIKKLIATHVGLNPEVATQSMQEGTLEVVLLPQGSFAEMCVIECTKDGLLLTEYNPEFTLEQIQAATEATLIVSPDLEPMA